MRNIPRNRDELKLHKRILHGELGWLFYRLGYRPEDAVRIISKMVEAFEEAVQEISGEDLVDKYNLGGTD